jgi:tRNA threonylcarbamoyladenosine modification (KEOPS) complex Cgi121 subunit
MQQNLNIQFFDADTIATREHLYFAVLNALQAFSAKTNHSKSPAMETIIYASALSQIQRAIERCGIRSQTTNMAVTIMSDEVKQIEAILEVLSEFIGSEPDESVLELTSEKKRRIKQIFEISDGEVESIGCEDERDAVVNLIIERVALLSTQL